VDVDRLTGALALALGPRTRRAALGAMTGGWLAAFAPAAVPTNAARKKKKKNKTSNPCQNRNWCVDRSHTCGPAGGFKRCLVTAFGGNVCAEILFQATTCADCAEPTCVGCVCVLATGGGDRCNNGANGREFVCARP
jgi:hypothetical protein